MSRIQKILLTFIGLTLTTYYSKSQDYAREIGVITKAELELETYPDDSEATAVKLFDIGMSDFVERPDGSLDIRFTRKVRIKILKEAAIDYSNVKIPYYEDGYGKTESFASIKATSYNWDRGKIIKSQIDKKQIFDETINEYFNAKIFAIPNVKVGSIIEYSYEKFSPFVGRLSSWEFQSEIPTIYSSYIAKMVPFYEYAFISQGLTSDVLKKTYEDKSSTRSYAQVQFNDVIYEFEMENIPAFYDDEYITSRNDYIKKLRFELAKTNFPSGGSKEFLSTWAKVSGDLLRRDSFGKYIKSASKNTSKNVLPALSLDGKTDAEKIQKMTEYVKKNYLFDGYYGYTAYEKLKDFEREKKGNAGNINLYLVGLLQSAGFNAKPVLLSTRSHGKIQRDFPFSSSFNYVIVVVELGDDLLMLDATESMLPFYLLPPRCLNDYGLSIEEKPGWINLESWHYSGVSEHAYMELDRDSLYVSIKSQSDGYEAFNKRTSYFKKKKSYFESMLDGNSTYIGESGSVRNLDEKEQSFNVSYKFKKPVDIFESEYYITPFPNLEFRKNPLTRKKRDYPVDFVFLKKRNYSTTFKIPEGYEWSGLPKSSDFEDKLIKFDYEVMQGDDMIVFNASYQFKKAVFQPKDYDLLKYDFQRLHKILNQQIVLKKSTTIE